jgi:Fic family protein
LGGWLGDGDDADPRSRTEAENSGRQARRLLELIDQALEDPDAFEVTVAMICELNAIAVADLVPNPGGVRTRDVVIEFSSHEPPPWQDVPSLLEEMCEKLNAGELDPIETGAYALWRINWIHPFEDGNGRTARAVAYLVISTLLRQRLGGRVTLVERILWKKVPYYRALEAADESWRAGRLDVSAMAELVSDLLKDQLAGDT